MGNTPPGRLKETRGRWDRAKRRVTSLDALLADAAAVEAAIGAHSGAIAHAALTVHVHKNAGVSWPGGGGGTERAGGNGRGGRPPPRLRMFTPCVPGTEELAAVEAAASEGGGGGEGGAREAGDGADDAAYGSQAGGENSPATPPPPPRSPPPRSPLPSRACPSGSSGGSSAGMADEDKALTALQQAPPWMLLSVLRELVLVRIEYDLVKEGGTIHQSRKLYLPDFYYVAGLLDDLGAVPSKPASGSASPSSASASASASASGSASAFASASASGSGSLDLDNECIICMDSQVEVVLPCTHAFCNDCLSEVLKDAEVSSTSAECPYCARNISNEGDGGEVWQLEEWSKDDAAQIAQVRTLRYLPAD